MDRMDQKQKEVLKEYNIYLRNLNAIICDWNLIPRSPSDEFGHLANLVLGQLWKGAKESKIKRIIKDEIIVTYGLDCEDEEAESFTQEIVEWWSFRN